MHALAALEIRAAASQADYDEARRLFGEYAAQLGVDLEFQQFERELAELPGAYAPPGGQLLLGRERGPGAPEWGGCVAVRPLADQGGERICEMKRLFVRPAYRRSGLGRALSSAILDVARRQGYARMRLDTLASMSAARRLYAELGFAPIEAYYDNPLPDVIYLEAAL